MGLYDAYNWYELPIALGSEYFKFNQENNLLGSLGMLNVIFSGFLPLFFLYHIRGILINRTTNEDVKISRLNFGFNN